MPIDSLILSLATSRCNSKLWPRESLYTLKSPLTASSPQWPPLQRSIFCGKSIYWLWLKPLYKGYLSTTATFFCPQGGRCREVQLYFNLFYAVRHWTLFCQISYPYFWKKLLGNEDLTLETIWKNILVSTRWKILEYSALLGIQLITLIMLVSNLERGSGKKHQNQIEEVSNKNKVNYSHKKPFQRYQPIVG